MLIQQFDIPSEQLSWQVKEKFERHSMRLLAVRIHTICDYRLRTGSSAAGELLSAYKRMNVESWMEMVVSRLV